MSHQDWAPVILKKASPKKVVSHSAPKPKPEEDGFAEAPKKFSKQFGQKISQLRQEQEPKMTRAMLAQKLKVKENVVASLENGEENYNPKMMSDLKKVLGNFDFKAF